MASASVLTPDVNTVVNVSGTAGTGKSRSTLAAITVHAVNTGPSIVAPDPYTIFNVVFTVLSRETYGTLTSVAVDPIKTRRSAGALVVGAVVDVDITEMP